MVVLIIVVVIIILFSLLGRTLKLVKPVFDVGCGILGWIFLLIIILVVVITIKLIL